MLEPLDRCRRDSTLFQFTTKQLPISLTPTSADRRSTPR